MKKVLFPFFPSNSHCCDRTEAGLPSGDGSSDAVVATAAGEEVSFEGAFCLVRLSKHCNLAELSLISAHLAKAPSTSAALTVSAVSNSNNEHNPIVLHAILAFIDFPPF